VQSTDCFDCGPPSDGNHCTARGFRANVKTYSSGGANPCPEIPSELPSTIEELNATFSCQELTLDNDEDVWCASVTECTSGQLQSIYQHGEPLQQSDGSSVVVSLGEPDAFLDSTPPSPGEAEATFTAAQTLSTTEMPALLAECLDACAPLAAVNDMHADVTLEHYLDSQSSPIVSTYSLSGMMTADGRFALQLPNRSTVEGDSPRVVIQELAFDGVSFFEGYQGEPYYRAYSSTSTKQALAMGLHERYVAALEDWVVDPLRVLRFPGTQYSVEESLEGLVVITESYALTGIQSPFGLGTTTYTVDASSEPPHVLRIEVRNDEGELTRRRDYSDFRTLENGAWRPRLVSERYYRASRGELRLTKTTRVLRATPLESSAIEAQWWRPSSDQNWWYIHN